MVDLHATLSADATSLDHPAHEYFVRRYAWAVYFLRAKFEEAAMAGYLHPEVEPLGAAESVVALMDGLQILWLYRRDSVDRVASIRRYVGSLLTVDL